jgi:FkbH-like protein
MAEPIRLVIWDLDETFWQGTVTEGGHRYNQATHDIVIELARRGIISSICSKNDLAQIQPILEAAGIWEYFVFPSIDWEPKGPRIAALVEAVQLRPETVLFIDDNPMNLNEALHFTPGLQTANEAFIPEILTSPLFKGKDDSGLTRLAQYKVLERRRAEEAVATASAGSNVGFLRGSNIRVRIERDVEAHLDRAIELINRTNQLNFTKLRLPEAPEAARAALSEMLSHHLVQAGLVEVTDNYGNYGYCGFYMTRTNPTETTLTHFCFSCRILNMGVEAWLYQALGRPALKVKGHVLSDPIAADRVDWIRQIETSAGDAAQTDSARGELSTVAARGGCVLMPLTHYFTMGASRVVGEYNIIRRGIVIRLDHSLCFRHALAGITDAQFEAVAPLGFEPEDFISSYFDHDGPNPIWIFSNWADLGMPIFKHRRTGIRIPYKPMPDAKRKTPSMELAELYLKEFYEPDGFLGIDEMKDSLRMVFSRVPDHGTMFALLAIDYNMLNGEKRRVRKRVLQNAWTAEVAAEFANVVLLDMADFIESEEDIDSNSGAGHFDRMVYYRLYQAMTRIAAERAAARVAA